MPQEHHIPIIEKLYKESYFNDMNKFIWFHETLNEYTLESLHEERKLNKPQPAEIHLVEYQCELQLSESADGMLLAKAQYSINKVNDLQYQWSE